MGPTSDTNYDANDPAVAYNSTDNQYLIVWSGDDDTLPLLNDEFEIWGRRLDANGNWLDPENVRLSDMGGLGDASYDAIDPDVTYNSTDNEYMIVWSGDDSFYGAISLQWACPAPIEF